jgi:hypothetical protein
MRSFLVPLYWSWCAVSVFILARRRLRRPANETATTEPAAADENATDQNASDENATEAATATPAPAELVAVGGLIDDAQPPPVKLEPAVARALADVDEPTPPAASEASAAIAGGVPMSTTDSLAEALEGIRLPCDLAPLIGTGDVHPREVVLVTSGHPAEVVGRSLADEFERLGFGLEGVDGTTILARDDRSLIELGLFADTIAGADGMRAFPTAPSGSVVARLRLR